MKESPLIAPLRLPSSYVPRSTLPSPTSCHHIRAILQERWGRRRPNLIPPSHALPLVFSVVLMAMLRLYLQWTNSRSQDRAVGIATGYGLDDGGVQDRVPEGLKIFFSTSRPDRFRGSPNLLSNWKSGRGQKMTTHLQLVPMSRKRGSIHQLPLYAFMA
jgi:hypothetical protein